MNLSSVGASVAVVSWLKDGGMKRKRYRELKDKVIHFQLLIYFTIQREFSKFQFNLDLAVDERREFWLIKDDC